MAVWRGGSEADLRTRAGLQLLQVLHRRWLIRKQVEARGRVFGELNPAIGEPVVEPMGGDPETAGELGHRQTLGHLARMRLMPLLQTAMLEANGSDRARQDLGALGRAIALLRQLGRDRLVRVARRKQSQNLVFHRGRPLQVGEGPHRDGDGEGGRGPAFPHHAGLDLVPRHPMDDDFVNETAQPGFALRLREDIRLPQRWQRTAQVEAGRPQRRGECPLRRVGGLPALGRGLFRRLECAKRGFPAPL